MKRKIIVVPTTAQQQFCDITADAQTFVTENRVKNGMLTVKTLNTTTAVYINENEQGLLQDVKEFLSRILPRNHQYHHDGRVDNHGKLADGSDEPRNGFAHLQAILLNNDVTLAIVDGRISLGTYQSVLFLELDGPRPNRQIELLLYAEELL